MTQQYRAIVVVGRWDLVSPLYDEEVKICAGTRIGVSDWDWLEGPDGTKGFVMLGADEDRRAPWASVLERLRTQGGCWWVEVSFGESGYRILNVGPASTKPSGEIPSALGLWSAILAFARASGGDPSDEECGPREAELHQAIADFRAAVAASARGTDQGPLQERATELARGLGIGALLHACGVGEATHAEKKRRLLTFHPGDLAELLIGAKEHEGRLLDSLSEARAALSDARRATEAAAAGARRLADDHDAAIAKFRASGVDTAVRVTETAMERFAEEVLRLLDEARGRAERSQALADAAAEEAERLRHDLERVRFELRGVRAEITAIRGEVRGRLTEEGVKRFVDGPKAMDPSAVEGTVAAVSGIHDEHPAVLAGLLHWVWDGGGEEREGDWELTEAGANLLRSFDRTGLPGDPWPSFHRAWGAAKDRPDYDKRRWLVAQAVLEYGAASEQVLRFVRDAQLRALLESDGQEGRDTASILDEEPGGSGPRPQDACTPSEFHRGAMESMSRRGDVDYGAVASDDMARGLRPDIDTLRWAEAAAAVEPDSDARAFLHGLRVGLESGPPVVQGWPVGATEITDPSRPTRRTDLARSLARATKGCKRLRQERDAARKEIAHLRAFLEGTSFHDGVAHASRVVVDAIARVFDPVFAAGDTANSVNGVTVDAAVKVALREIHLPALVADTSAFHGALAVRVREAARALAPRRHVLPGVTALDLYTLANAHLGVQHAAVRAKTQPTQGLPEWANPRIYSE